MLAEFERFVHLPSVSLFICISICIVHYTGITCMMRGISPLTLRRWRPSGSCPLSRGRSAAETDSRFTVSRELRSSVSSLSPTPAGRMIVFGPTLMMAPRSWLGIVVTCAGKVIEPMSGICLWSNIVQPSANCVVGILFSTKMRIMRILHCKKYWRAMCQNKGLETVTRLSMLPVPTTWLVTA